MNQPRIASEIVGEHPARATAAAAPRVLISILNWNGLDATEQLLRGLDRSCMPWARVLVIDNGSAQDPSARLGALFPDIDVLRLSTNLGFTGGHNIALAQAIRDGVPYLLLLNNDTRIESSAIAAMLEQMESSKESGACSALVYSDEDPPRPLMVSGWLDWRAHRSVRPSVIMAPPAPESPPLVVGTCLLIRTAAMERIGPLDDDYFAYFDDNDLSARMARAGYAVTHCARARCHHDFRQAHQYSALAHFLSSRNAWLFWTRHTPRKYRRGLRRHLIADAMMTAATLKTQGATGAQISAVADGLWCAWRGDFGNPQDHAAAPGWLRRLISSTPFRIAEWLRR